MKKSVGTAVHVFIVKCVKEQLYFCFSSHGNFDSITEIARAEAIGGTILLSLSATRASHRARSHVAVGGSETNSMITAKLRHK